MRRDVESAVRSCQSWRSRSSRCSASARSRSTSATRTTRSASCRARPTPPRSPARRTCRPRPPRSRPRPRTRPRTSPRTSPTSRFTYETKCTATAVDRGLGCNAATNPNALVVTGTAQHEHLVREDLRHRQLRRLGARERLQPVLVDARSTSSSCSTARAPCADTTGSAAAAPTSNNAKDGVHTLLSMLNPPYAQVGMIAFPPLDRPPRTPVCNSPQGTSNDYTAYDSADARYLTDQISSDYKTRERHREPRVRPLPAHGRGRRRRSASARTATRPTARRCARPRPSSTRTGAPTSRTSSSS